MTADTLATSMFGPCSGLRKHLATERGVSAATHQQALSALLFLYRNVLTVELPWLGGIVHPKAPSTSGSALA